MNSFFKRLKFLLQLRDGLWSIPLGFFMYYFVGLMLGYVFGYSTGVYDPSFIQPLFLAGVVVAGATNFAVLGVYFNFREIHRYIYGHRKEEGGVVVENCSKDDFNKTLTAWQRLSLSLFLVCFFIALVVIVYLKLV